MTQLAKRTHTRRRLRHNTRMRLGKAKQANIFYSSQNDMQRSRNSVLENLEKSTLYDIGILSEVSMGRQVGYRDGVSWYFMPC